MKGQKTSGEFEEFLKQERVDAEERPAVRRLEPSKARLLQLEPTAAIRVVWAEPYQVTLCITDEEVGVAASTDNQPVKVVRVGIVASEARRRLRQRAGGL
jgi:hypothetical protein